jgi:branched-chain amino acid aminotransferase
MVLFNNDIIPSTNNLINRGLLFGDGVFETIKVRNGKILFLEDHYFRLMSAMRICRMEIPMTLTMEFFAQQIGLLLDNLKLADARVRVTVFRDGQGYYKPEKRTVSYLITASYLPADYIFDQQFFEVDLYKDFFVPAQLLSTVKTTNKMLHVLAGIYAVENNLNSCLLLNEKRQVIEAIEGNLFVLLHNELITPPVSEGCLNGIMRKQILELAAAEGLSIKEAPLATFELQNAEEMFITNVISGIKPITRYRKKDFNFSVAELLSKKIQERIALI